MKINSEQEIQQDINTIHRTMRAPVSIKRAFSIFTEDLANWWPAKYTWSQDVLETIAIKPGEGGRCFERGSHNFECDWDEYWSGNRPNDWCLPGKSAPMIINTGHWVAVKEIGCSTHHDSWRQYSRQSEPR